MHTKPNCSVTTGDAQVAEEQTSWRETLGSQGHEEEMLPAKLHAMFGMLPLAYQLAKIMMSITQEPNTFLDNGAPNDLPHRRDSLRLECLLSYKAHKDSLGYIL